MKKLLLTITLFAGFCEISAETPNKNLERIKLFQAMAQAFPALIETYKAYNKGLIEFSSRSKDSKDCIRNMVELMEEAETIQTNQQAEQFTTQLQQAILQCKKAGEAEFEESLNYYKTKQLSLIKVVQQAIKAFPEEYAAILANARFRAAQGDEDSAFFLQSLKELQNITTEKQAQAFTAKFAEHPHVKTTLDSIKEEYEKNKTQKLRKN